MATRVAGRTVGSKHRNAALAGTLGLAALGVSWMSGCDGHDAGAQAISDASIQLRSVSPGSVPPTSDEFATSQLRASAGLLQAVEREGTDAQKAIAAILSAEIETGLSMPALSKLAEVEHEVGMKLTRMASLETARVTAQQTAEALRTFDASAQRSSIDERARALQSDLATARQQRQQVEQQAEELAGQIAALEARVSTIRGEESTLRDRALREGPIEAAATIEQARLTSRQADALEVQASTLDAQRAALGPQVEALSVRINAIDAQLAMLSTAREGVEARARQAESEAAQAERTASEHAAQIVVLAVEIGALHQNDAQTAMEEAQQSLEKAVSTARRATDPNSDGTLTAARASRTLGDVLAWRAGSLEHTARSFRGIAERAGGEQSRRLSTLADQLSQQADGLKQDAIGSYEQAMTGFGRVRAKGQTKIALDEAAENLGRAIERLGGKREAEAEEMDVGHPG